MSIALRLALLLVAAGCVAPAGPPPGMVELDQVIEQVERALDDYQTEAQGQPDVLPPLAAADLTFKATTSRSAKAGVSLLVLKLGAARSTDAVNEVTFSYVPKARDGAELLASGPTLADELRATIRRAAEAVARSRPKQLDFAKLTVVVQFGVRWSGSAGIAVPVDIATVGLDAAADRGAIQTVKLTFAKRSGP